MKHINYFDLGLWKKADELSYMVDIILPQFKNITYTAYGIEAHPEYAGAIDRKYKDNPNVKIFNKAISNESFKTTKLYISDVNGGLGNSIFKTKNNVNTAAYVEIETTTFSNWLIENKIDLSNSINILKSNIEGAELFLWEDFKKNDLRQHFHIFCGHPSHDIYKVKELSDQIQNYTSLLKDLNLDFVFFCHTDPKKSIEDMTRKIKSYSFDVNTECVIK